MTCFHVSLINVRFSIYSCKMMSYNSCCVLSIRDSPYNACNIVLQEDQGVYVQKVRDMITDGLIRLVVNINDLRKKNPKRAQE